MPVIVLKVICTFIYVYLLILDCFQVYDTSLVVGYRYSLSLGTGFQTVNIMKYYCVRYIRIVIDYTLGLNGIGHRVTVQVKSGLREACGVGSVGTR